MRRINDWLASRVTLAVFTMQAVYSCILLSVLPVIHPAWMEPVLFISNAVQLTLLSLVGVGSKVLNVASEARASQDHETIMQEMADLKMILAELGEDTDLLDEIHKAVVKG